MMLRIWTCVALLVACSGETEFRKMERQACACKTRDCALALEDKAMKLLLRAANADEPREAVDTMKRAFTCLQEAR